MSGLHVLFLEGGLSHVALYLEVHAEGRLNSRSVFRFLFSPGRLIL